MKKIISIISILLLTSCSSFTKFGAGVDITFDPRTIGMQIDDTIMQKNLSARLALLDKKYFLYVQSEVIDGRIFLSGKVDGPEEKIKITKMAWETKGVRSVKNAITIKGQSNFKSISTWRGKVRGPLRIIKEQGIFVGSDELFRNIEAYRVGGQCRILIKSNCLL